MIKDNSQNTPNNATDTDTQHQQIIIPKQPSIFKLGKISRLVLIKKDSRFAIFADKFGSLNTIRALADEPKIQDLKTGDHAALFIYKNNRSQLKATTEHPKTILHELTTITIEDSDKSGYYANWGWIESIFIPRENTDFRLKNGSKYVMKLALDPQTQHLIGYTKANYVGRLSDDKSKLNIGQHVCIRTIDITDKQITALIDDKYLGVLDFKAMPYIPEIGKIELGEIVGFTEDKFSESKDLKPDNKTVIVKLNANMNYLVTKTQQQILDELADPRAQGMIPFNDNSSAKIVLQHFGVSKNVFKRAIGGLLKQKAIKQTDKSIVKF